jgi:hypothetical protein
MSICGTPVIHINVSIQFLLNIVQPFGHIGIDSTSNEFCQS